MTQGSSQELGWYQWAPQTPSQTRIEFKDRTSQLTKTAKSLDLNLALSGAQAVLIGTQEVLCSGFWPGSSGRGNPDGSGPIGSGETDRNRCREIQRRFLA